MKEKRLGRADIMDALREASISFGSEYTEVYESLKRLERTDRDSFDGLINHFIEQGFSSKDDVLDYVVLGD